MMLPCLGWVKNNRPGEEEMMMIYRVGTFERVAPEWMRDVILFSNISMLRTFFHKAIGLFSVFMTFGFHDF
ncbi:hypothetical protein HanRHA438_Chr02g0097421 [Helianthus annuus]|nr:hypothetical protein HanRHA438_Chr02g0097421 [Helianthus annuus]